MAAIKIKPPKKCPRAVREHLRKRVDERQFIAPMAFELDASLKGGRASAVASGERSCSILHSPRRISFADVAPLEQHKQNHGQQDRTHPRDRCQVRPSKHHPQSCPAHEESQIHRVPHVAIEPRHHQRLRRSHWGWRSASRPSEIPHAPERYSETKNRRQRCNPAPTRCSRRVNLKAQPPRQQPEPQRKKCRAHNQGSGRCQPRLTTTMLVRIMRSAIRISSRSNRNVCHAHPPNYTV